MTEIRTGKPNPCGYGGKCLTTCENSFICEREQKGYKGHHCEIGVITTPIFPKLRPNSASGDLLLLARPSKRLRVSFNAENEVTFNSQSLEIQFPERNGTVKVKVAKPGIWAVTYTLIGQHKADFETPEKSVIFVAPELPNNNPSPFIIKGELGVGCLEQETKDNFACKLRLLSTAPWSGTPGSTNGIVHLVTTNNQIIPLSLIGLNLNDLRASRDDMIETSIAKTSKSENISLWYERNSTCESQTGDSSNLLQLIENDAFVSAFMEALSEMAPDWLKLVAKYNKYFDIQNIVVTLGTKLTHCSGFPFQGESTLAYYRPAISYKIQVDQIEVPLFADGRTCFAINVCKPGLFINFPKKQSEILKSKLEMFQDMKDCCEIDVTMDSIGFLKEKETSYYIKRSIWNGLKLLEISYFTYNAWFKGSIGWRIEIPKRLFVTIDMSVEAIIKSRNIDFVSILIGL